MILLSDDVKKYAYDPSTGAFFPLTSLQYKVAENLSFPLPPVCPTAVRYELAKYDADAVRRAYAFFLDRTGEGYFGAYENAFLRLSGDYAAPSQAAAEAAIAALGRMPTLLGDAPFADALRGK